MLNLDQLAAGMSAIAAVASAVAAVKSLAASRQAVEVSERVERMQSDSQLEAKHVVELQVVHQNRVRIPGAVEELDLAASTSVDSVIRAFEAIDSAATGGRNPRPLRHVLYDGGMLIAWQFTMRIDQRRMVSIESELDRFREQAQLLASPSWRHKLQKRKAEESFGGPEATFGLPPIKQSLIASQAIRWTMFDCVRRTHILQAEDVARRVSNQEIREYRDFLDVLRRVSNLVSAVTSEIDLASKRIDALSGDRWRKSGIYSDLRLTELERWCGVLIRSRKYLEDSAIPRLSDPTAHLISIVACHHLVLEACSRLRPLSTMSSSGSESHLGIPLT